MSLPRVGTADKYPLGAIGTNIVYGSVDSVCGVTDVEEFSTVLCKHIVDSIYFVICYLS